MAITRIRESGPHHWGDCWAVASEVNRAMGEIEAEQAVLDGLWRDHTAAHVMQQEGMWKDLEEHGRRLRDLEEALGRQGERWTRLVERVYALEGRPSLEPVAPEGKPAVDSLLPCPFCGGEAQAYDMVPVAADVRCPSCRALVSGRTLGEARDRWNRRAA